MALDYSEFIRRFLMHVLPKGLMRIRHYGLLANRCRQKSLKVIRKILATPVQANPEKVGNEPTTYPCPKCRKGLLIPKYEINPVALTRPLPS
jgi:hypothetical protein